MEVSNSVTNIVVSRYKKDVSFAYKINGGKNINVMVYDKETPSNQYNVPVNKGNEASVYLKYIVDYYDDLPAYTFFIHDEEYAWHHSGSIIDKYDEAIGSRAAYYNVNDKCQNTMNKVIQCLHNNKWKLHFEDWYEQYIENYIPLHAVDFNKSYLNSAQFLVHRDVIRCLPKEFYQRLYDWIITTDLPNAESGRFLEWTWHLFWDVYPKGLAPSITGV